MWTIIRRAILPTILLFVGLASIVHGVKYHTITVFADEKSPVTIDVPRPFPQGPPQFSNKTLQKTTEVVINQSEPELIREVTVGGVALNESGKIKRTYSGKPPSLCPT
jgi:hypothetical protein